VRPELIAVRRCLLPKRNLSRSKWKGKDQERSYEPHPNPASQNQEEI